MALDQTIQNLLLAGRGLPPHSARAAARPPPALAGLIAAIGPAHAVFNRSALEFGIRYRSAFWSIYLLSALAVLCAVAPLAMGWDDAQSSLSRYAIVFVLAEVLVILLVGLIYWRGNRQDWQGQWLGARTRAELAWYLPLIAPLADLSEPANGSWYASLFDLGNKKNEHEKDYGGLAVHGIAALCDANRAATRHALDGAWQQGAFVGDYARWAVALLSGQRDYHRLVHQRQHALLHRVHTINTWLFGMTGLAALAHLVIHSRALTLLTTVLPALGASLHGALAQSEAYRLAASSTRLADQLDLLIATLQAALQNADPLPAAATVRACVRSAVELIIDEHQDWHMLVRPHHLPLG